MFNWGKGKDKPVDYPESLTMPKPKKPHWLARGAEGSSTLVREKLIAQDGQARINSKRATGWAIDPSPNPENDATNIRPSKMGKGKTPKDDCPWQYEAVDVHKSKLTDPMDIPRPGREYKKPRRLAKTTQASEGPLTNFRGKSITDPKRLNA